MTEPRRVALLFALACLSGCARVIAPAGGPEDKTPPVLLKTTPDSGAVNVPRSGAIELAYTEWIDPATVKNTVSIMPAPSRTPEIDVDGPVVRLRLREPLDSATTVILRVGAGIADFRNAATTVTREIPFSTGPALDSGKLVLHVWNGSDSTAPAVLRGKVGFYPLDSTRRAGLARLLRRRDSTSWLAAPPSPWREKAWRWALADSLGGARLEHLPAGKWRVVVWDDKDKDGYWRSGEEALGWAGDLDWTGRASSASLFARLAPLDTVAAARDSSKIATDSVKLAKEAARRTKDSLRALQPEAVAERRIADSLAHRADSLARRDSVRLDSLAVRDASLPDDSARVLVLDSLPREFRGSAALRVRLFRQDQRRRPVVFGPGPNGPTARVPRGGKWAGEIWVDRDGDGRIQSGDPFRHLPAEPWRPLQPLVDDPSKEDLVLRLVPVSFPADGVAP